MNKSTFWTGYFIYIVIQGMMIVARWVKLIEASWWLIFIPTFIVLICGFSVIVYFKLTCNLEIEKMTMKGNYKMNIKKQFKRILEYIDDINIENARLLEVLNESINKRNKLTEENARLHEVLRWHPISELPRHDEHYPTRNISVNVLFRYNDKTTPFIAWCDRGKVCWINPSISRIIDSNMITGDSQWCYIPEDKNGK